MATAPDFGSVTVAPGSEEEVHINHTDAPGDEVTLLFGAEWVGVPDNDIALNVHANRTPVTREVLEPGEASIWGNLTHGVSVAASHDGDGVSLSFTLESGAEAFDEHLRNRGALPELSPPAEGRQAGDGPRPNVPRALDRRIPDDEVSDLLDVLASEPWGYAITFPEADAPPTYIRAQGGSDRTKEVLGRFAERHGTEWDADQPFVGVRQNRASGAWERRDYSAASVAQRVRRSPAVRLVHWEDAPDALWPDDCR